MKLKILNESTNPKIVVDDSSFEGKTDPTQYDAENGTILVKSTYNVKKDEEGWIVHELVHHKMKDIPNDDEYPKNTVEKHAYAAQFKHLKNIGYTIEDVTDETKFPTLSIKFQKYPEELNNYWNNA